MAASSTGPGPGPTRRRAGVVEEVQEHQGEADETEHDARVDRGPCPRARSGGAWPPGPPAWGPAPVVAVPAAITTASRPTMTWPLTSRRLRARRPSRTTGDTRVEADAAPVPPSTTTADPLEHQDEGVGQQGDAHHEVGHDDVRVELGVDDHRAQDRLADDAPEEAGRQPHQVPPARRPQQRGHQRHGGGDAQDDDHHRFPNSMAGCNDSGGVSRCCEHVGQSGQPSPESVRRTAAPVTMFSTTITTVTWVMRRKARGVTPGSCTGGPSYRGSGPPPGAPRAPTGGSRADHGADHRLITRRRAAALSGRGCPP